jgi:hypothetical protein
MSDSDDEVRVDFESDLLALAQGGTALDKDDEAGLTLETMTTVRCVFDGMCQWG